MKFNLVIDIDDKSIADHLKWNPTFSIEDIKGEINNACYLGLGCVESIILNQVGLETNDTYVEKLS
jgi:hypothetical protein